MNDCILYVFLCPLLTQGPTNTPGCVQNHPRDKGRKYGKFTHPLKGTTEDEMVGWHHQLNGHEFEQASGDGEGQGNLVCCSQWDHKELDTTEQLN